MIQVGKGEAPANLVVFDNIIGLPVIPELKLTDLGLVDGRIFDFVPVMVATDEKEQL